MNFKKEINKTFKSAQLFVEEMKRDSGFRDLMSNVNNREAFGKLLKEKGYDFDPKDLVRAMAVCMADMEAMMGNLNS